MTARPPVVFFSHVPYGFGHWSRSVALLSALRRDFQITLIASGRFSEAMTIPEGVEAVWLPAKYRDEQDRLTVAPGFTLREATLARTRVIQQVVDRVRPAAVIVEYYPFGHWETWSEVLRLVETAKYPLFGKPGPLPLAICSLRDIQQTRRPYQEYFDAQVCEQANELFDAILVHSDPALTRFEETFPMSARLRIPVHHTGFVVVGQAFACPVDELSSPQAGERLPHKSESLILVSAGGGLAGESLLMRAIEAQRSGGLSCDFRMRAIAGVFQPEAAWARLQAAAEGVPKLELIRWSPDLCGEMARAAVSVSRCGYNTALDVLRSGARALFVPYATPYEDEQTNRADRLSRLGLTRCLHETEADPQRLACEIRQTAAFEPARVALDFTGGPRSAELLRELLIARGFDIR